MTESGDPNDEIPAPADLAPLPGAKLMNTKTPDDCKYFARPTMSDRVPKHAFDLAERAAPVRHKEFQSRMASRRTRQRH